jgi:hypothetical protein
MQVAPGKEAPLGFFPDNLDRNNNGWTGQAWAIREQALGIGKKYHFQNLAIYTHQQAPHKPPPELPDIQVRNQLAKADAKRIAELKNKKAAIEAEVSRQEMSLQPFNYEEGGIIDALRRKERRDFLRTLPEDKRHEPMAVAP